METVWPELGERRLRYQGHTWALSGTVDVRDSGAVLAVEARSVDDDKGQYATLFFDSVDEADSLNPGNLGEHFDRLERAGDDHHLVVTQTGRTYRYELHRVQYD